MALCAVVLGACASSGGSGLREVTDVHADDASRELAAERATEQAAEIPEQPEMTEAQIDPASLIDTSIEANLEEISERTQRGYDEALAAMRSGNLVQAELQFEQLIESDPGFPGLWVNLAIIYKSQGRAAEARTALEQALAIAPNFSPANNELGILLREQGEFAAAELAYRSAVAADPNNARAHLNLGILLDMYLYRPAEALEHFNLYQSAQVEPDESVARWIVDLERRVRAAARVAQD